MGLGTQEILLILVVVLILFGGKKIPELMRGVGQGMGELQKGIDESKKMLRDSMDEATRPKEPVPIKAIDTDVEKDDLKDLPKHSLEDEDERHQIIAESENIAPDMPMSLTGQPDMHKKL